MWLYIVGAGCNSLLNTSCLAVCKATLLLLLILNECFVSSYYSFIVSPFHALLHLSDPVHVNFS